MSRKKITPSLKKLVLRENKKAPHLGLRGLASLLAKKYKVSISKSAVGNILKAEGIKAKAGRKKALFLYKKTRGVEACGLLLLRAIDDYLGLFDYLTDELGVYFPRIKKELLKKLIILASFSSFIGDNWKASLQKKGFLRLVGLKYFPARRANYFDKRLSQYKPVVELKRAKENLELVSTIKFYFKNGYQGFSDAKMSTFWDSPCKLGYFFLPLRVAKLRLKQMLEEKIIIIGYTKSFDYLSPLAFNFIKSIEKGLKKVQFLDQKGQVLEEMEVVTPDVALLLGYSPAIVSKGVSFLNPLKRFQRFFWPELGEFYALGLPAKFLQPKAKEEITLSSILIKSNTSSYLWGLLLVNKSPLNDKRRISIFLKKYLYLWPYVNEDFFKDMERIEKSLFSSPNNNDFLRKMLPQRLPFTQLADFVRVGQILSALFKEIVWGWEPKGKSGDFTISKDYIEISLKEMSLKVRKSFNKSCFYIDKKRVFLK